MTTFTPSHKGSLGTWIRWMILPLLLGTTTMVLISRTDKQEMEIAIAVTFNNVADDLLLMDTTRQSVRLMVSGRPSDLGTLDPRATFCRVDLSGLGEGTHTVIVNPADIGLPKGVSLSALLTPLLSITLKPQAQKTVDVIAVLEGDPAPGFAVEKVSLKPDRIVLTGLADMLAGVDTIETHPIDLKNAADSFKKEVPLNLPEAIAVAPPLRIVLAQVEVKERIVTRVLKSVPVRGKGTSAGHRIHPDTITLTVSGPEAIVNTLETNPAFAVTVDLDDLPPGNHSHKATINLPLRTTLVHVSPERFSVTINQ